MVEGGRKENHILVNKGLDDRRVSRCGATTELLPLGKVMRVSSGNRCRCITLMRGRRRDSHIDNSIVGRGRSRVEVVMRVKLEANVGRAGVGVCGGGGAIRYFGSLETQSREAMKPARGPSSRQTVPKASRMALLGATLSYVVAVRVKRAVAVTTDLDGKLVREDGSFSSVLFRSECQSLPQRLELTPKLLPMQVRWVHQDLSQQSNTKLT
jgi:hypothetical protein